MIEEHIEKEEHVFEEASIYESEWFQYSLYFIGILLFGLFAPAFLSFNDYLELVAESLQKACMPVGMIGLLFCIIKLALEEGFFSRESDVEPMDTVDARLIVPEEIELNKYTLQPQSTIYKKRFSEVDISQKKITHKILNEMEWLRFEQICSAYFTRAGYKNTLTGLGADGGVDIKIYDKQSSEVVALVQCKRINNPVTVKLIREFYGVMSSQKIQKGYYITTSTFNNNALDFASSLDIELIDGAELLRRFGKLPQALQNELYELATSGDYKTPSCVKCGVKMVQRNNKKTGEIFWACPKYMCKTTLKIKSNEY